MDHLLSKELFLEQTNGIPDERSSRDVKDEVRNALSPSTQVT
ncbi:hypothetical protein CLV36_1202 [Laceyella sediminis]|uniref:Uncharacterized protein n=1 Tax=Laceyella sediminis TaxID=573074 RepID=A0ABX5EJG8_9BACL|nr:hypothetical protein CLV36_1202 [Laceyella sediminis]